MKNNYSYIIMQLCLWLYVLFVCQCMCVCVVVIVDAVAVALFFHTLFGGRPRARFLSLDDIFS